MAEIPPKRINRLNTQGRESNTGKELEGCTPCRSIVEKVAVLIADPCGTGKSHLAQSLGYAAARQGYDVLFITQAQLMASLRTAQRIGTYKRRHLKDGQAAIEDVDEGSREPAGGLGRARWVEKRPDRGRLNYNRNVLPGGICPGQGWGEFEVANGIGDDTERALNSLNRWTIQPAPPQGERPRVAPIRYSHQSISENSLSAFGFP
jgi:hypothetical protein